MANSTTNQAIIPKAATDLSQESEEKKTLRRELLARDAIITEMKKKEQWWRTEVLLARRQSRSFVNDKTQDDDAAQLMSFSHEDPDKTLLFEQLVSVKAEMKKKFDIAFKSKLNQSYKSLRMLNKYEQLR